MRLHLPTGVATAQSQQTDGSYELSSIQTTQQQWEEESAALDGHAAHLTMSVLKEEILEDLTKIYEQENKPKDTVAKTTNSSEAGQGPSSLLSVPHPSDQATPSSPRGPATVDQLRSSLRQVADALAQTVAAVRNTREHLQDPSANGDGGAQSMSQEESIVNEEEEEEEEIQFAEDPEANLFLSPYPLPPPSPPHLSDHEVPSSSFLNPAPPSDTFQVSDILAGAGGSTASVTTPFTQPLTSHTTSSSSAAGVSISLPPPQENSQAMEASTTSTTVSSFSLPTPMFSQATSVAQAQSSSTATTTVSNTTNVMSSFDGSQESARATLEQTDPQDPLYTFLSAYVGAPPPPISSSVGAPPPVTSSAPVPQSQSAPLQPVQSPPGTNVPHSVSSPRLPVFTQMQSPQENYARLEPFPGEVLGVLPSESTMDLTIPPSSTYSRVTSSPPPPPPPRTSTATTTAHSTAHHSSSAAASLSTSQAADVISIAENIASQVTSFFQSNPLEVLEPSAPPGRLDQTASLANSLAQELSRSASQLTPSSSGGESGGTVMFPQLMPTSSTSANVAASNSLTIPRAASSTLAGQSSPSPSDTLAPLISSLQMPTPPVTVGAGTVRAPTAAEGTDRESPGSGQVSLTRASDNVVAEETGRASVIAGRPWPEVGEIFAQGGGGEGLLEPVPSASMNVGVSEVRSGNAATSEQQRSQSSAAEEGATVGTQSGIAASSGATANVPSNLQQLPDTIDREVLAALPEHIQQEVLSQHAREQRARQARQEGFSTTISPEFLSALPPNIQEEVSTDCHLTVHLYVHVDVKYFTPWLKISLLQ